MRPTPSWEPATFLCHALRYGTRRLQAELRAAGHAIGRYIAARGGLAHRPTHAHRIGAQCAGASPSATLASTRFDYARRPWQLIH